jgi:hypothetical protein
LGDRTSSGIRDGGGCASTKCPDRARTFPSTLFSTLNYERILEYDICQQGMSIDWWNFPSLYADFASVFKLHGSCNFVPRDVQATRDVGYTNAASFPGPAKAILNVGGRA